MKKYKWIIFLLVLCAALSFLTPVGAQASDLNFGPISVSSGNSSGVNTSMESPICHDSAQDCDSFKIIDIMRNTFAENKLVPQTDWLENRLRETRKEITAEGCNKFSMEDTMNSIVMDHVNHCNTAANPHIKDTKKDEDKGIFEIINENFKDNWYTLLSVLKQKEKIKDINFAYTHNCQATALSYAMCRQGYDVQAHGNFGDRFSSSSLIDKLFPEGWQHRLWTASEGQSLLEAIEEKMAEWEDGTVIMISAHTPKILGLEQGHLFIAEKINGKVVFLDPQDPERTSEYIINSNFSVIDNNRSFFFPTNDIDFSQKLKDLTLWVDEKEVVENTVY